MMNAELLSAGFSYLFGLPVAAQVQAVELAQHGSSVRCGFTAFLPWPLSVCWPQ